MVTMGDDDVAAEVTTGTAPCPWAADSRRRLRWLAGSCFGGQWQVVVHTRATRGSQGDKMDVERGGLPVPTTAGHIGGLAQAPLLTSCLFVLVLRVLTGYPWPYPPSVPTFKRPVHRAVDPSQLLLT